jgi:exodeoxyribonuclease V beta subunit
MSVPKKFDVVNCELDGISLIEASAGTGKTWNICGLYLRLLLERGLEVQQILVVTFTNAATAELRDRIRKRIVEMRAYLLSESPAAADEFIPALTDALINHRGVSQEMIVNRLDLALQTFDEASIFTIHGFCQRALADTPFAAGQAFSQELLPDDSELLLEVVHDYWRRHIAGDMIGTNMAAFLLQKKDSPEKFAALLKRNLAKPLARLEWPASEAQAPDPRALTQAFSAARECWDSDRPEISSLMTDSLTQLNGRYYSEASLNTAFKHCDFLFESGDALAAEPDRSKLGLLRATSLSTRTNKNKVTPEHAFFELMETLLSEIEKTMQALEQGRFDLLKQMIEECSSSIRRRKRERRVLSFDDILYNLHAALSGGGFPDLALSLQRRFPAALIDEFQDTDPLQHSVFGQIYGDRQNPMFMVGDPKQAIYSFRNADLHTYLKAKRGTTAIYSISDNQRATEPLISAVNALFSANRHAFILDGLDYQDAAFGKKRRKEFADRSGTAQALQIRMLPKDRDGSPIQKRETKTLAAKSTAAEITRLLTAANRGEVTIDGKPLQAADIAVLVRSHAQGSAVRDALAKLNVGSVELSQASVFHSSDAEEIERILTAIWSPNRTQWLRAAMATELIGCNAETIEAISHDEATMMDYFQRFGEYRETWIKRGIGYAFRQFLTRENISRQMLRRTDGERRMTNLLHLGELLHQAEQAHASPDALLRWLQAQRREGGDEAAQLRLESDQNLVQILTIHKSKGLEFPIVFCTYLWDGHPGRSRNAEGIEYHNDNGDTVIDFRTPIGENIRETIRLEKAAEDIRLFYVALTRAEFRCYLFAGCYTSSAFGRPSTSESEHSLLNWLVAGGGNSLQEWADRKRAAVDLERIWHEIAHHHADAIHIDALGENDARPFISAPDSDDELVCQPLPKFISHGWRTSSFSGLKRGAVHENAASDHDAQLIAAPPANVVTEALPGDDILLFPRGASAGECIHKAFELCDFTDGASWDMAISRALSEHPQQSVTSQDKLAAMMRRMMHDVLATPLPDGISLDRIGTSRRLNELGFYLPSSHLQSEALNTALHQLGYATPRLSFNDLDGYLNGYIDLVFEHGGRYYIVDWKSNHLGNTVADYGKQSVAGAMAENAYHLQYLLYAIALDRYLARRINGYRYDTHFGGVLYLFVRGVRPDWRDADGSPAGVFFDRPAEDVIRRLGRLFGFDSRVAA